MQYNDEKLVQLTLEGDHDAFAVLVEKYQSQIHALAWRKIGTDAHLIPYSPYQWVGDYKFVMNFRRCGLNPDEEDLI